MPLRFASLAARTSALLLVLAVLAGLQVSAAAQGPAQDGTSETSTNQQSSGQQGRRPGPPSPAMELDRIIKAMKAADVPLSDAQKVSILGILEDRETAQKSLQSSSTDRATMMQQMQALDKASRTAILAVLTEAQQKVYATLRQGPGGSSGAPSGGPPSGTPPQDGGTPPNPPSGSSDQADNLIDANTGGGVQQSAR